MRKNNIKYLHFFGDHGHRNGQDSLVKGWSYTSWNKNGERVIDFMCLDIDWCDHSSEEVVAGIEKSFCRIQMFVPGVKGIKMKWKKAVDLFRLDKFNNLVKKELSRSIKHQRKVTEIDPKSDKMMELFKYQADYFLQRQER